MPLVEIANSADDDFRFLDVALRDADEGSYRSGLRSSMDNSHNSPRTVRKDDDPLSNSSNHSGMGKRKEYDTILTKKLGDSPTPFAEATLADEVPPAEPEPEETSSEDDRVTWLEGEVARLKLELANAKAARDWHQLRFRKAQTEFQDLQAFSKKLQDENEQLKSKVRSPTNNESWFTWMQSTPTPPTAATKVPTPPNPIVANTRRGSMCSELTPDNDDVLERASSGSWWQFRKFEENDLEDGSEQSGVVRSARKNSLVIESLDADEPEQGTRPKGQYRSTTDGHLVGIHNMM